MALYPKFKTDLLLAGIYLTCIALLTYCYPTAQFTWDSYYYIEMSHDLKPNVRPGGYPFFLNNLNGIAWSLPLVITCQYILHFLSIWFLLRTIDRIFSIKTWQYFLLGVVLITEPVALYHCFNILSDILFSALSIAYITTLILLIRKKSTWLFVVHVLLIFACIEVRHIALFYPYFSFVLLVYYHRSIKLALLYGIVIFGANYTISQLHIQANKKQYGVPVYSPFSGWTHANNALYGLPYIKLDTNKIVDVEVRQLHSFCSTYMDTSSFKMPVIGSGFLWDPKSPLCILRQKIEDSLDVPFFHAWYILSRAYGRYGIYLQKHYPMAYIKGYIIPNTQTLITPHDGEMMDYYATPDVNVTILEWYHKKQADLYVRHQVYKNHINYWNLKYHQLRLVLFILAMLTALFYARRIDRPTAQVLVPLILFTGAFYVLTLYSSWFMHRYLIPVIPLQVAVIFIVLLVLTRKRASATD